MKSPMILKEIPRSTTSGVLMLIFLVAFALACVHGFFVVAQNLPKGQQ